MRGDGEQTPAANALAIVGMDGRFPGARDIRTFWANLRTGIESIRFFTDEELLAAGESPDLLGNPAYVKAFGHLADIDKFDAPFFGMSPRDAAVFDPQHRLFLECAWGALEDAGYVGEKVPGPVAVFGSSGPSEYMMYSLVRNRDIMASVGAWLVRHNGNDTNFLATRVAYELNLAGPAMSVQTACSSSLVAVHLACQSLLNGECEAALAGGSTIYPRQDRGYLYKEGEILSPDGHCRAFDTRAAGTVMASAVGCVVLKRLEDALRDGDNVRAIIRGSAINNDGAQKVGYLAPSVPGQTRVIREALSMAGVDAEDVSYIEAHGTATLIGDPIEITALTAAFRGWTRKKHFCALGSLKSNIGHAGEAAGICGLIKTVLALEHRELPPSLHYDTPNPHIDFANSPFFVNDRLREWAPPAGKRRIAGVTALGAGGTNVHVLIEEAPEAPVATPSRAPQMVVLSARTPGALDAAAKNLASFLRANPGLPLADIAHTLLAGRKGFACRRAVVARDALDAADALEDSNRSTPHQGHPEQEGSAAALALATLARSWVSGAAFDEKELFAGEKRRRVSLPTYPFERQRYWVDDPAVVARSGTLRKRADLREWFYAPAWGCAAPPVADARGDATWLVFADGSAVGAAIVERLRRSGARLVTVSPGGRFAAVDDSAYILSPSKRSDYDALAGELRSRGMLPDRVLHLWALAPRRSTRRERVPACYLHAGRSRLLRFLRRGANDEYARRLHLDYFSLIFFAQAFAADLGTTRLTVVSSHMQALPGDAHVHAEKAVALGACRVIPREHPHIACATVDVAYPTSSREEEAVVAQVARELAGASAEREVAYRQGARWVRRLDPVRLDATPSEPRTWLRERGVYLVTGGLGGIGLTLAEYLARRAAAKLVLIGRRALPHDEDGWTAAHGPDDETSRRIASVRSLGTLGAEVLTMAADVTDLEAMRQVRTRALARFGALHGIFHAAGVLRDELIALRPSVARSDVLDVKMKGALVLDEVFGDMALDPFVLFSSVSSVLGLPGQADYTAANSFLDAFAHARAARGARGRTISIDWNAWQDVGMLATRVRALGNGVSAAANGGARKNGAAKLGYRREILDEMALREGMTPAEGVEALERILANRFSTQVVACTVDLDAWLDKLTEEARASLGGPSPRAAVAGGPVSGRPNLGAAFVAPRTALQREIAAMWSELLGVAEVGVNDDFFELGGQSLIAVRLFHRIEKKYGLDLSIATLFQAPTIAQYAALLRERLGLPADEEPAGVIDVSSPNPNGSPAGERSQPVGRSYRSLVNIRPGAGRVPFFCVHGAGGNVLNFRDLASGMDPRQPFFGLQAYGIDGVTPPHETIEEMARAYLVEVRDVQPHGPYLLGGYSGGGVVAFEMAQQLTNEGQEVRLLAFIDTFHPELVLRSHPMSERLARLREGGTGYVAEVLRRRRDAIRLAHHLRVNERHPDAKGPIPFGLRSLHLTRNFETAISRYRAKKWAGRATLFRAEQLAHLYSGRGPRYGWERDILSGVELVPVPGNHRTILRGANATALLGVLNVAISRAQSGSPPTSPIAAAAPHAGALAFR